MQTQKIDYRKEGWEKFTFRCSSLGHIMTDPKEKSNLVKFNEAKESFNKKRETLDATVNKETKSAIKLYEDISKLSDEIARLRLVLEVPSLSDSCKTHLSDVYTRVVYDRNEDVKSKYLEKGLHTEEDVITQYSLVTGKMYRNNKERRSNEWIEGEMDFIDNDQDMVLDAKSNWSIFQFNRVAAKAIRPLYHWQLDGYMWLWEKSKGKLVYGLINTPEHLIVMEEKKLLYDFVGSEEDYLEACKELRRNHIYDDIPIEERIRTFDVKQSEERVEKIKSRVKDCRLYLNNFSSRPDEQGEEE